MKADSDIKMAVNAAFNAIVHQVQISNLNFIMNMTPYGAYIALKKDQNLIISSQQST